jgi:hypothetical protein
MFFFLAVYLQISKNSIFALGRLTCEVLEATEILKLLVKITSCVVDKRLARYQLI